MMDPPQKPGANLFQVYLRLRPTPASSSTNAERFLLVEEPEEDEAPTQITLNPPNDRRRAVEKFAFTRVFEEDATQLDLFQGTQVLPLLEGVLAPHGGEGTDGLLATLGVTGSGKTHTMLGSRSQRGLTQLALDVIFRSLESNLLDCTRNTNLEASIQASDSSEATFFSAPSFLETVYNDFVSSRMGSRAGTPMTVRKPPSKDFIRASLQNMCPQLPGIFPESPSSMRLVRHEDDLSHVTMLDTPPKDMPRGWAKGHHALPNAEAGKPKLATASPKKHYMFLTSAAQSKKNETNTPAKSEFPPPSTPRPKLQRPSAFPQVPSIDPIRASCDPSAEYAILISMYEVYNDRIFDLLTPPVKSNATKEYRRRPLLFKSTEQSPDRKVVAGLRKVICGSLTEALMVLEAGLHERRVAGTGSNSTSSRSHGFFCVEMQSDMGNTSKPNLVPFRQCKLTELLFSNSFPSPSFTQSSSIHRRNPQKAVMVVTADPVGDFNATSQILRYSALARTPGFRHGTLDYGERSPEIARMAEMIDQLNSDLSRETEARIAAETHLLSMEDRLQDMEQEIREECYTDFERRLALEMNRWKASLSHELERGEEHWDRKVEVLARGVGVITVASDDDENQGEDDKENVLVENLEQENERLRRELAVLKRELGSRTPSKRAPLQERGDAMVTMKSEMAGLGSRMEALRVSSTGSARSILSDDRISNHSYANSEAGSIRSKKSSRVATNGSPTKKVRKLQAKKWEPIGDDDI
ncbi:hypothetical protein PG999_013212 [Apiospora kogelbergensis]|uniref:Kinesin motor domain-containing protein n=1 Tax=Apiospora kogelbergensis TaxID=1337665 RepID=A0AAW0QQJ0_9PEZI